MLHQLIEEIRDYAILILNPEGIIASWNAGAAELTGYAADEAIGQHVSLLYAPREVAAGKPQDDLQHAAQHGAFSDYRQCATKSANLFGTAVTITSLNDSHQRSRAFSAIIRKVGDQHDLDRTTRLMVDLALNALVLVNRRGEIIRVNPQTEKLFGYTPAELIGQQVEILVPDALRHRHPAYRDAFFANPAVRAMGAGRDLNGRRKDGSEFPVEIGLNPIESEDELLVLGSIVDISERKRAEEMFRLAVESAPSAMIMVNDRGDMELVNLQTERLFGYRRSELLGKPIEMLVPERFRSKHPAFRQSFFSSPTARPMGAGRDLRGRRQDGSEFPVEIGLTPISIAGGWHVLSAIVDITERKEAEEHARLHLAEMAHALRLSTVGEMFSGLAHEINQPLAAAANYARTCVRYARSEQGISQDQLIEWMEKTAAQAARAIEIVKRVGTFVRTGTSKRTSLNLNGVIRDVLTLPGLAVGAVEGTTPIVPQLELDEHLPSVLADRVQIEQVLVNLFRNAVEAMADVPPAARRLVVRTRRNESEVVVSIADNGHGISTEDLAQLFNPFFTTKIGGMGLGLSISRSIVEAHLGRMSAESTVGVGTTLQFSLPADRLEVQM